MEKLLTSKKPKKLIQRHRKERDKRIFDCIKVVLAYDDGHIKKKMNQSYLKCFKKMGWRGSYQQWSAYENKLCDN